MIIKEIEEFQEIRYKARAYLCYIFSRNIPNYLPNMDKELIFSGFNKISHELIKYDAFYLLDKNGYQIGDNISLKEEYRTGGGENRSLRSYYYNAVKERRCYLTDPYPSSLTGQLCITVAMPIYNAKKELLYIACADIDMADILKLINPRSIDGRFGQVSRVAYTLLALALFGVTCILFFFGIKSLFSNSLHLIDTSEMFESTVLLTLALAILDLVKAIFEEEILGAGRKNGGNSKTMIKFLTSIIIALAIEALMLVFKFAMTKPEHIVYAVYLIVGVSALISSLGFYLYMSRNGSR